MAGLVVESLSFGQYCTVAMYWILNVLMKMK